MTYFVDLNWGGMKNKGNGIKFFLCVFFSYNKIDLTQNFPYELWGIFKAMHEFPKKTISETDMTKVQICKDVFTFLKSAKNSHKHIKCSQGKNFEFVA